MALDKTQIKFIEYDVYFKGTHIGYLKKDTTTTSPGIQYRKVDDTAQFVGVVAANKNGAAPTAQVEIYQADFPNIFGALAGDQVYPIVSGASVGYGIGSRTIDLFQEAGELRYHPTGRNLDDVDDDITYWLAFPMLDQIQFGGKRDTAQSLVLPFQILPDEDAGLDLTYGIYGDATISEADPDHVFVNTEYLSRAPHRHISAITLKSHQVVQFYAHAAYYDVVTDSAAINEAGNVSATEFIFNVDGIADSSTWTVGSYFLCQSEIFRITAVTVVSATEVTVTVNRGLFGTTQATHADNTACDLLENVYVIPVRRRCTWASSSTGDFTVGNSNASENKGLVTWVADGSGNLTATIGATASPATVVTTTV